MTSMKKDWLRWNWTRVKSTSMQWEPTLPLAKSSQPLALFASSPRSTEPLKWNSLPTLKRLLSQAESSYTVHGQTLKSQALIFWLWVMRRCVWESRNSTTPTEKCTTIFANLNYWTRNWSWTSSPNPWFNRGSMCNNRWSNYQMRFSSWKILKSIKSYSPAASSRTFRIRWLTMPCQLITINNDHFYFI